jgi:hypothetical protein
MKAALILRLSIVLNPLLCSCNADIISKESLTCVMPILNQHNAAVLFENTFYKTNYNNVIIYEFPHNNITHTNGVVLTNDITYDYFVFSKADKYGFMLDSLNDNFTKKLLVDSVLTEYALQSLDIDTFSTFIMSSDNVPVDNYNIIKKTKLNDAAIDSAYFYYNKNLKGLNYSLSHKLDSINKSKLFKVELIIKKDTLSNIVDRNKYRMITYEIKKCTINNKPDLAFIYRRFREMNK